MPGRDDAAQRWRSKGDRGPVGERATCAFPLKKAAPEETQRSQNHRAKDSELSSESKPAGLPKEWS